MAAITSFPTDWMALLDRVERTLSRAIHEAEAREAGFNEQASASLPLPADSLEKHIQALAERAQSIEVPLKTLDESLSKEETQVREHLSAVSELSRKFADWSLAAG